MSIRHWVAGLAASLTTVLSVGHVHAIPIDPNKTPVDVVTDATLRSQFTLAYDDVNPNIVYYAPKGGRAASLNGAPLVGFVQLPDGRGFLNAQFEYGVFGADQEALFRALRSAGKTPVQFPFRRTSVVPLTPEINPETGAPVCEMQYDPILDREVEECFVGLYERIQYARRGPTLGENIAVTALLSATGGLVFKDLLKQGSALQLAITGEYYAAGTAFRATVTVDYDKLFQRFHAKAAGGILWGRGSFETLLEEEALCAGRRPQDCGVFVRYFDSNTGREIDSPTIDPGNRADQLAVLQAIQRLKQRLESEMLTAITPELQPVDVRAPLIGFRLKGSYERRQRTVRATFEFTSSRGVNLGETVFPVSIGCIDFTPDGYVQRASGGDCDRYWSGTPRTS